MVCVSNREKNKVGGANSGDRASVTAIQVLVEGNETT